MAYSRVLHWSGNGKVPAENCRKALGNDGNGNNSHGGTAEAGSKCVVNTAGG